MKKVYFKKTIFGMVLMVEDRKPNDGFGFDNFWRRATEEECQKFLADTLLLEAQKEMIDTIKDSNPEFFL